MLFRSRFLIHQPVDGNDGYAPGYLVLYKGRNDASQKVVTFQKINPLGYGVIKEYLDFAQAGARVSEGKAAAFQWGTDFFELTTADPATMSTYALRVIPSGELYPISNVQTSESELSNGTIVFGERLIYLAQSFDVDYNIQLHIEGLPYALIGGTPVNVSAGAALLPGLQGYIAQVGGTPFGVGVSVPNPPIVGNSLSKVIFNSLTDDATYFMARLGNDSRTPVLLPTGESVVVHVVNSTDGLIQVEGAH